MKLTIYSVYDSKAKAFMQPFYQHNLGATLRSITEATNNPEHQFCKTPEDFTLFEIGQFDDEKGSLVPLIPVKPVTLLVELKEPTKVDQNQVDMFEKLESVVKKLTELAK